MTNTQNRLLQVSLILFSATILSACSTAPVFDVRVVEVGTHDKIVLREYGAPDKIQKVQEFNVWSYVSADNQNCQLFFHKRALAHPVKCLDIPPSVKRGFASSQ